MELPVDTDASHDADDQELEPSKDTSFLERFHRKLKRVRSLDLSRLKRAKSCRFYCRPAVGNRDTGVGGSLKDTRPYVRVMIHHCLRCLRRKGYMSKIMERKFLEKELIATPSSQTTSPSDPQKKQVIVANKLHPYHHVFGGWISLHKDGQRYPSDVKEPIRGFRRLLNDAKNDRKNVITRRAIIIGDRLDEDYVNNYEDIPDGFGGIDFGKLEEKIRDWAPNIFLGAFVFFGILFVILFPVINFINMCVDDFRTNCRLFCNILCCRDPKYTLVKKECKRKGIFIPKYRKYKKLMKRHKKLQISEDVEKTSVEA
ncbi:unnamed protein product [Larinioides sclopetarius]|uniref:Uncharacterized protein n=1 Tax=Larinioides sclopetarius TaxID=280406 RepID=A0AAV2A0P0_9ARAC